MGRGFWWELFTVNSEETTKHIYILAGSYQQASEFAREKKLHPSNWSSIYRASQLSGISRFSPFIKYGTWYELKEIREIEMLIQQRELIEVVGVRVKDGG